MVPSTQSSRSRVVQIITTLSFLISKQIFKLLLFDLSIWSVDMACATLKRAYDWDPLNSPNQSTTGPGVSQSSASKPTGSTMLHHHNHHHSLPNTHNFTTSSLPSTHSHAHHRPSKRRCLFVQHHHNQHVRPNPPKEPSPFSFVHARFSAGKSTFFLDDF